MLTASVLQTRFTSPMPDESCCCGWVRGTRARFRCLLSTQNWAQFFAIGSTGKEMNRGYRGVGGVARYELRMRRIGHGNGQAQLCRSAAQIPIEMKIGTKSACYGHCLRWLTRVARTFESFAPGCGRLPFHFSVGTGAANVSPCSPIMPTISSFNR